MMRFFQAVSTNVSGAVCLKKPNHIIILRFSEVVKGHANDHGLYKEGADFGRPDNLAFGSISQRKPWDFIQGILGLYKQLSSSLDLPKAELVDHFFLREILANMGACWLVVLKFLQIISIST